MTTPISGHARADAIRRLRAAGCVFAEDEQVALAAAAADDAALAGLVTRRAAGEPLEQVVGYADFCGLRIRLRPGVFVPRLRSELLARLAVDMARQLPTPIVVDLCCGSGALGAAVLHAVPGVLLHAADLDPTAVACARDNLTAITTQAHNNSRDRITAPPPGDDLTGTATQAHSDSRGGTAAPAHGNGFEPRVHQGDLFEALPATLAGRIDVLVANVPYVPTGHIALLPAEARLHEPRTALDGGDDGLDVLRAVTAQAPRWLAPGGVLLSETTEAQVPAAIVAIREAGLRPQVTTDDECAATVVHGNN